MLQGGISRLDSSVSSLSAKQEEVMKQHNSVLAHMKSVILAQSKEISELKLKLGYVESHIRFSRLPIDFESPWLMSGQQVLDQNAHAMVFKFTDYAKRKSSNTSAFSPPIYSSPGGYKMSINVVPDGNGDGKGTHVSVYAYLMRGENDDHLPWPFTGTVIIELLNQLTDQKHISMSMKLMGDANKRVLDGDKAVTGCGYPRYIEHSSLDYNATNNCQYLKDDCLYVRVKIDSDVSLKPWLASADLF